MQLDKILTRKSYRLILGLLVFVGALAQGCNMVKQEQKQAPLDMKEGQFNITIPPLQYRENGEWVTAPAEVQNLAQLFVDQPCKGQSSGGICLSILPSSTLVNLEESVFIIHVFESLSSQESLYPMGPKEVVGEYVNGSLKTAPASNGVDAWLSSNYDGPTVSGPGKDFHFELTRYSFDKTGVYQIVWKPGDLTSNTISISVTEP